MTPNVLVLGIGNDFRGDDAVGLLAARELESMHLPHVNVVESRGDGARLMRLWKGYPAVLVIDAVH
jgi:hydrogenase maturation protease